MRWEILPVYFGTKIAKITFLSHEILQNMQ